MRCNAIDIGRLTNKRETDEHRSRSTSLERASGTNE